MKETINLSAFGASAATKRNLDVATINIETESSGIIPIQVLIVPMITTPIQNKVRAPIKDLPYLRQLKLTHPVTSDENFEISLLIGADHYWDFVQDHIIRGNGPTAMQSKLGYLLSGPIKLPAGDRTPTNILNVMISHYEEDQQLEKCWSLESLGILDQLPTTMKVASRVSTNNLPFLVRMTVATLQNFHGKTIIQHCLQTFLLARNLPDQPTKIKPQSGIVTDLWNNYQ
jgi:hypothetical protein